MDGSLESALILGSSLVLIVLLKSSFFGKSGDISLGELSSSSGWNVNRDSLDDFLYMALAVYTSSSLEVSLFSSAFLFDLDAL